MYVYYMFSGERAYAVGHACFSEHAGLQPSVTKGAVSKVIRHKSKPVMIQVKITQSQIWFGMMLKHEYEFDKLLTIWPINNC